MELILLEKVKGLGRIGDQVSVKPGYGRNFLVPQGKAIYATPENVEKFEQERATFEKAQEDKLSDAQARGEKISALESISLLLSADPAGKLYGSVSTRMLADAITQAGCEVQNKEVKLPEGSSNIRQIGEYVIEVKLHDEVTVPVNLVIEPSASN